MNMVSKKNFQQNDKAIHQQRLGFRGTVTPYKKPFNTQSSPVGLKMNQMMFNASQIPDNPGYMDFNNPTPPIGSTAFNTSAQQKKKNNRNKQKIKPTNTQKLQVQQNGGVCNWNPKQPPQMGGRPNRRFNGIGTSGFNAGMIGCGPNRNRRMIPPFGHGPRPGPLPPIPPPHGFQPPIIPPMPPMGRGPMPPMGRQRPPFMRHNPGRGEPMPIPPPMTPIMAPRIPRGMPVMPFNGIGIIKKPNAKLIKKVLKSKSTIKTLKNIVNQYPLDKPWVTEAIRGEHAKKVNIENQLKGNKNDELFAQFKTQRDKFVALYEAAREEYLKQEAAAVKAKDGKETQTKNRAAAKDVLNTEAIPNKSSKPK